MNTEVISTVDINQLLDDIENMDAPIARLIDHAEEIYLKDHDLRKAGVEIGQYIEELNISRITYSKLRKIGSKASILLRYAEGLPSDFDSLYRLACKSQIEIRKNINTEELKTLDELMTIMVEKDCPVQEAAYIANEVAQLLGRIFKEIGVAAAFSLSINPNHIEQELIDSHTDADAPDQLPTKSNISMDDSDHGPH